MAFEDTLWSKLNDVTTQNNGGQNKVKSKVTMQEMGLLLKDKTLWAMSLFYLFYLGACMTAGGWVGVVKFPMSVQAANCPPWVTSRLASLAACF